ANFCIRWAACGRTRPHEGGRSQTPSRSDRPDRPVWSWKGAYFECRITSATGCLAIDLFDETASNNLPKREEKAGSRARNCVMLSLKHCSGEGDASFDLPRSWSLVLELPRWQVRGENDVEEESSRRRRA